MEDHRHRQHNQTPDSGSSSHRNTRPVFRTSAEFQRLVASSWLGFSSRASMDLEHSRRTRCCQRHLGGRATVPSVPWSVPEAQSIPAGQHRWSDGGGIAVSGTSVLGARDPVDPNARSTASRAANQRFADCPSLRRSSHRPRRCQLRLYHSYRRILWRNACVVAINGGRGPHARHLQFCALLADARLARFPHFSNTCATTQSFSASRRQFDCLESERELVLALIHRSSWRSACRSTELRKRLQRSARSCFW